MRHMRTGWYKIRDTTGVIRDGSNMRGEIYMEVYEGGDMSWEEEVWEERHRYKRDMYKRNDKLREYTILQEASNINGDG